MLNLLDLAGLVAILAVLGGGAPILVTSLAQAVRARRLRQLLLFCVPPLAATLFALFAIVAIPASGSRVSNTPGAPLSALAVDTAAWTSAGITARRFRQCGRHCGGHIQ